MGSGFGLFNVFKLHPILGIGYNSHSLYLLENVPKAELNNVEFINRFLPNNYYAAMCIPTMLLAQFGVLINAGFIYYVVRSLVVFKKAVKKLVEPIWENRLGKTLADMAVFYGVFYFLISFFNFAWNGPTYVVMFFFLVVAKQIYVKKADSLSIIEDGKTEVEVVANSETEPEHRMTRRELRSRR
jgi:O-antigen ligase